MPLGSYRDCGAIKFPVWCLECKEELYFIFSLELISRTVRVEVILVFNMQIVGLLFFFFFLICRVEGA